MELDQLITYANGPLRWLIAAMSGSSALAFHYCGYWKILSNNSINFSSPNNSKKRIPPGFFYHLLGFFFLIVFLWSIKAIPFLLSNNLGGNDGLSRIIVVVIALFTGFALKITYDQVKEARDEKKSIKDEIKEKFEDLVKTKAELSRTARWVKLNSIVQNLRFEDDPDQRLIGLTYVRNIYTNPLDVNHPEDLGLDLLLANRKLRELLQPRDQDYIKYLARNFTHDSTKHQESIRKVLDELVGLLAEDSSKK